MDEAEVQSKINKILDFHRNGLRDIDETVKNLNNLCRTLDNSVQDKVFDYLLCLLVAHLSKAPLPTTQERTREPSIVRVIIRAISEFGPAQRMFPQLFAYLDPANSTVTRNWAADVFPELVRAVYEQPDRFSQGSLNAIKANTVLHSAQLRGMTGIGSVPNYVGGAANLERAIEDLEFKRFEKTLSYEASGAAAKQAVKPAPDEKKQLDAYIADLGLDPSIGEAMMEARDCLRTDGVFQPKKAADLIRSSMEQMNCNIVSALTKLKGKAFAGKDSDGGRRQYMREVEFITLAEEKFFSAVYGLISKEGSHKLDAPKETILVMERTISDYLLLLARRLSEHRRAS
jgi:hypothetical protein